MDTRSHTTELYRAIFFGGLICAGLSLTSWHSYLLFHTLAEVFSLVIACAIFILAWNVRQLMANAYLQFLGIASLFIGGIDLVHTFAYKGLPIFPGYDANLPTQLWIAARYLESLSLLIAPVFFTCKLRVKTIFASYSAIMIAILAATFARNFPDCFVEGVGLTSFKILSEYIICGLLAAAIVATHANRPQFNPAVLRLLMASLIVTIGAELAFTRYISVYGPANLIGHLLKILAVYLRYKAIIETGLRRPYRLLFRDLAQQNERLEQMNRQLQQEIAGRQLAEATLQRAHDELEQRVAERTAQLVKVNRMLQVLNDCNQAIARADDETTLAQTICDILVQQGGCPLARVEHAGRDAGGAAREDMLALPLKDESSRVLGALMIAPPEATPFTAEEVRLLKELAGDLAHGIAALRLRAARQAAMHELQESEERYRTIFQNAPVGIFRSTIAGRFLTVNPALARMHGYDSPDAMIVEITNIAAQIYASPEDRPPIIAAQLASGGTTQHVVHFRRKDGSAFVANLYVKTVRDAAGRPLFLEGIIEDLTEYRRLEALLAQREREFRSLAENSPDAIFRYDRDGRRIYINPTVSTMFDRPAETLLGNTPDDGAILDAGQSRKLLAGLRQVFESGQRIHLELEVVGRRDDQRRVYDVILAPEYDADDRVATVLLIGRDITERKAAEKQLVLLNHAVNQSNDEIFLIGERFRFVFVNDAACRVLGYSRAELLTMTPLDIDPDVTLESMVQGWEKVARTKRTVSFETRHRARDGQIYPVETSALIFEHEGVRFNLTICRDITARKQAETELEQYRNHLERVVAQRTAALTAEINEREQIEVTLRETTHFLATILDHIPVLVAYLDPQFNFIRVNRAYAEADGQTPDFFPGQNHFTLYPNAENEAIFRRVAATGEAYFTYAQPFAYADHPERGVTYWDWSLLPVCDPDGAVTALLMTLANVTERERGKQALQTAKEAAEAANRAKSVFLANMSHELRTPLHGILGFAQLLRDAPQLTASQHAHLDVILTSGEHLLTLINDVLEIARIEAGRIELRLAACDLDALIREALDMLRQRADAKQLSLTLHYAPDAPRYIQTDVAKLRQIVINLIGNAIKFTAAGGVTVRVSATHNSQFTTDNCELRIANCQLCVEVEDTGMGIAPADQERIFKPFEQVGTINAIAGSGLGLAITRQYLELMGGAIRVISPPARSLPTEGGPGAVLRFEIPVQPAEDNAVPNTRAVAPKRTVVGIEPGQPAYRILIVDDQSENRILLRTILESAGFAVRETENGTDALDVFQDWRPQVILMDRRLPGMDGLTATRRIKALAGGAETIIIVLTASAFAEQREEALAAGADDFIRKPFRPAEIFETLRKHLGVRYAYQNVAAASPPEQTPEPGAALTSAALAVLPPELLDALEQAALQLDVEHIDRVIAAMRPAYPAIAGRLAALAQNFQCKMIWNMIQQTRK